MIYISKAKYIDGLMLRITFNDSLVKEIGFAPFFQAHPHPQYNKYSVPKKFKKFTIDHRNLVWGKNWDLIFPIESLRNGEI